jgi:hypothetical protein
LKKTGNETAVGEQREPAHQGSQGSKADLGNRALAIENEAEKDGVQGVGGVLVLGWGQDRRRFRARNRRIRVETGTGLMQGVKANVKTVVQLRDAG